MHRISVLVFSALFSSTLSFANISFERTAETSLVLEGTHAEPIYRTECLTNQQFGRDSSCGSYEQCTYSMLEQKKDLLDDGVLVASNVRDHRGGGNSGTVVRDHRSEPIVRDHRSEPIVRDHRRDQDNNNDNSGNHHHHHDYDDHPVERRCWIEYNSCWHDETSCSQVLDHEIAVNVRVNVDWRSVLLPGEKETLTVAVEGYGNTRTLKLKTSSKEYGYTVTGNTQVDLSNPLPVYVLDAMLTRIKPRPVINKIHVAGAGYTSRGTFVINFSDPLLDIPEVSRTYYKVEVRQGKKKRIAGTFNIDNLVRRSDGLFTIEVYPEETEWVSYPDERSKDTFILGIQVRPEAYFLNPKFSAVQKVRLLQPFPKKAQ